MDPREFGFRKEENGLTKIIQYIRCEEKDFAVLQFSEQPDKEIVEHFSESFLLMIWKEQEDVCVVCYSKSKCIRPLEFLDYLLPDFGLVKGGEKYAEGRISAAILEVQMLAVDLSDCVEFFLRRTVSYFEDCDWIYAQDYGVVHKKEIESLPKYQKRKVAWAYVKSLDLVEEGRQFKIKSLENESGITLTAGEDTYIMIGCRGEIYDIKRQKFEATYDITDEMLDIFERMLDFLPEIVLLPEETYVTIDEVARMCYPKKTSGIYAKQLAKRTKIFPKDSNQEYFLGREGDYMAICVDNLQDSYIIQKEIFEETYEEETK